VIFNSFGVPFQVIDFSKVSWTAIADSLPTMLALILFSLIHVVRLAQTSIDLRHTIAKDVLTSICS
jgi:MFS superfamily sulfate permease-like transporter